jgi:hypothetical protein
LTRGGAIGFFSAKLCHTEIGKLPQSDACCNQYTDKLEEYRDESPLSCVSSENTPPQGPLLRSLRHNSQFLNH